MVVPTACCQGQQAPCATSAAHVDHLQDAARGRLVAAAGFCAARQRPWGRCRRHPDSRLGLAAGRPAAEAGQLFPRARVRAQGQLFMFFVFFINLVYFYYCFVYFLYYFFLCYIFLMCFFFIRVGWVGGTSAAAPGFGAAPAPRRPMGSLERGAEIHC